LPLARAVWTTSSHPRRGLPSDTSTSPVTVVWALGTVPTVERKQGRCPGARSIALLAPIPRLAIQSYPVVANSIVSGRTRQMAKAIARVRRAFRATEVSPAITAKYRAETRAGLDGGRPTSTLADLAAAFTAE
jgi:hypothetical protein